MNEFLKKKPSLVVQGIGKDVPLPTYPYGKSLYKPYKYHGYTVRGTPNCPLSGCFYFFFIPLSY